MPFPPSDHRAQQAYPVGYLPLLDDAALSDLLVALDNDSDAVVHFVSSFVDQWPERVRRINDCMHAHDSVDGMTAVLSVSVSSQMIGATRLTALTRDLELAVRANDFAGGLSRVGNLRSVGSETLQELTARLHESELRRRV